MSEYPGFERASLDEESRRQFREVQEAIAHGNEETLAEQLGVDAEGMVEDLMEGVREVKPDEVDREILETESDEDDSKPIEGPH